MKGIILALSGFLLLAAPDAVRGQFGYVTNADSKNTITITNYTGPGGIVTIPTNTNGLTVTGIGEKAFYYSSILTNVTIPDGVIHIGGEAFYSCVNLTNAAIPPSVTDIGTNAFEFCNLTSVTIPGSVTNIGEAAFAACFTLTAITVDGSNSFYSSMNGLLFNKSQNALIQCPGGFGGSYTISGSVTSIGDDAFFKCDSLTSVTIPGSVANIGENAFGDCISLTAVYFQGNAPVTDPTAFSGDPNVVFYYLHSGSLQVNLYPAGAVSAGALWQVDGGATNGSGVIVSNLAETNHVVSFIAVPGWNTPPNQTVAITSGVTTWASGIYTASNAPPGNLILITNGSGTIQHAAWPQSLVMGKKYVVRAVPKPKNVFVGWVGGTNQPYSLLSASASYTFPMRSDLVLEANFATNIFLAGQGTYRGLFAPANPAREQANSGSFLFSVTSGGAVSGNLNLGGQTVPFSGKFNLGGAADIISKSVHGIPALTLTLQLDFAGQSVSGAISNGMFSAELNGYRNVFSSLNKSNPFEGQYTLVIPGTNDSAVGPFGNSYGTVKVSSSGTVTLAGSLADGTAISQSSVVSQEGYWPLYVNLYGGKGSLWGWNYFANQTLTAPLSLSWINATNSSKTAVYRSGFTNQEVTLSGGLYLSSQTLPSGLAVTLEDSNFTLMIPNLPENTNKLTLKTNKTTGLISGSFANPADSKQMIKVSGVILQGQTKAQGYFLGTNQSGSFLLESPQN